MKLARKSTFYIQMLIPYLVLNSSKPSTTAEYNALYLSSVLAFCLSFVTLSDLIPNESVTSLSFSKSIKELRAISMLLCELPARESENVK